MPVRSLNSPVMKWPSSESVRESLSTWAKNQSPHPNALVIAAFGSLCRGNWGVGSDIDLVVIVERSELPFSERALKWDTLSLPVPVDLLIYTKEEWGKMAAEGTRFVKEVEANHTLLRGAFPR